MGVDIGGAGDQGIMFGYACKDTENYMPYAIDMAHKLAKKLTEVRKTDKIPFLGPDGKTQVTVEYENNKPKRIETILIVICPATVIVLLLAKVSIATLEFLSFFKHSSKILSDIVSHSLSVVLLDEFTEKTNKIVKLDGITGMCVGLIIVSLGIRMIIKTIRYISN